ncbi:hypothetical protein P8942_01490 [Enterococcus faecium]|uniref:Rgg/GadR/MutR family transcriptional regulator n=1 Tax=Enterococcus faecium TaxID=1352 RepID=UPI002413FBD9|nr:Rgg/GadR/MutR family transcriptional regulator [Enterococcus faecium]MDG4588543.1 hypothetical protein [Enterococcus faecium]
MREYGEVIKEFRVGKNMSLLEVSNGVMSISQLSKFERGETEIVFHKMRGLLANLNVTFEELELAVCEYSGNDFKSLLIKIRKYYSETNIGRLQALVKQELFLYKETNLVSHKLNAICIKSYLYNIDKAKFPVKLSEKHFISEYLFSIEKWTKYEILLFTNSISILTIDTVFSLTKEMIKLTVNYKSVDQYNRVLIQSLVNVCILGIENQRFSEVFFFKKVLSEFLLDDTFLYEKNVLRFLDGYLEYACSNKKRGMSLMKSAIGVFEMLDSVNLAYNFSNYLKEKETI